MRRYNEFSALWRAAILQKPFYQDVAQNWRGIGLRYLLLLVSLTWIIALLPAFIQITHYLNTQAPSDFKNFPTIHIVNGVASSEVPQPAIYKDDTGAPFFVLDTTGAIQKPSDAGAKLLLTSTEIIQEDPPGNIQRHKLTEFRALLGSDNATIDEAWLLNLIASFRNWMIPMAILLGLCGRLLAALGLAAIGLAFNARCRGGLSYAALLRLSILAMTGPLLLDALLWLLPLPSTFGILWLVLILATFVYLFFAVKYAAQVIPKPIAPLFPPSNPNLPPSLPGPEQPGSDMFP